MAWNFSLKCPSLTVTGAGQWQVDTDGTHTIHSALDSDDISALLRLEQWPAVVGIYESSHTRFRDAAFRLHEDDQAVLNEFSAGQRSAIAIASAYDDSIGLAVFYETDTFSRIVELVKLAIQTEKGLWLSLDFLGFGRRLDPFTAVDYLSSRSICAGIARLSLNTAPAAAPTSESSGC